MAKKKGKKKKGIFKKIIKGLVIGASLPFLAPLLLLKPAMIKALKTKGHTPAKNFKDLVVQFHSVIIKKEPKKFDFVDTAVSLVKKIVPFVITYFKELKNKKDKGEKLTENEEKTLSAVGEVADKISEGAQDVKEEKIGEGVMKYLPLIAIAGILFFVLRK